MKRLFSDFGSLVKLTKPLKQYLIFTFVTINKNCLPKGKPRVEAHNVHPTERRHEEENDGVT